MLLSVVRYYRDGDAGVGLVFGNRAASRRGRSWNGFSGNKGVFQSTCSSWFQAAGEASPAASCLGSAFQRGEAPRRADE